ncbi:MAG: helix-turn-helix domain-containing protein [Ktedonobacterales bacterium]
MTSPDETKARRQNGRPIPYLRAWRDAKLVTAGELATKTGKSRAAISRIEHGGGALYPTIKDIAAALGISTDELLHTNPEKRKR